MNEEETAGAGDGIAASTCRRYDGIVCASVLATQHVHIPSVTYQGNLEHRLIGTLSYVICLYCVSNPNSFEQRRCIGGCLLVKNILLPYTDPCPANYLNSPAIRFI